VWAADGEHVENLRNGGEMEVPVWMKDRLQSLGRDPDEWAQTNTGRA
jgi:hypothetical protein